MGNTEESLESSCLKKDSAAPKESALAKKRAEKYNEGVARAKGYEKQGKLLIIAPDDTCGVDTLTRNKEAMKRFYDKGFEDASEIALFLSRENSDFKEG